MFVDSYFWVLRLRQPWLFNNLWQCYKVCIIIFNGLWCSVVWTYLNLFNHSLIDEHKQLPVFSYYKQCCHRYLLCHEDKVYTGNLWVKTYSTLYVDISYYQTAARRVQLIPTSCISPTPSPSSVTSFVFPFTPQHWKLSFSNCASLMDRKCFLILICCFSWPKQ